jgi:hypothetical protein
LNIKSTEFAGRMSGRKKNLEQWLKTEYKDDFCGVELNNWVNEE